MQVKLKCEDVIAACDEAIKWYRDYPERRKAKFISEKVNESAKKRFFFGLLKLRPITQERAEWLWENEEVHSWIGTHKNWAESQAQSGISPYLKMRAAAERTEDTFLVVSGEQFAKLRPHLPRSTKQGLAA